MRRGSVRLRVTAVFAVAMTVVILGIGLLVYASVRVDLLDAVDRDLGGRADALTAALAADPQTALESGHRFVDPDEAFAQILRPDGTIVNSTAGVAGRPLLTASQAAATDRPTFFVRPASGGDDPQRVLAVPITLDGQARLAVVGATLGDRHDALVHLVTVLVVAGAAAVTLTTLGGWLLVGAALRPVEEMRRRAAELARGDADASLPVSPSEDELSRLGRTLNHLLDRQRDATRRELRFVDEASHQLRTPLAVLKAELDLSLSRRRSPAELLDALRSAARETDRLCRLTEDLLVLARSRQAGPAARREPVDLGQLVTAALRPLVELADSLGRTIDVRASGATVWVDPSRVGQGVFNLVENALWHGVGAVTVLARVDAGMLVVEVHDEGAGFPDGVRDTAFEPFTRGRPAGRAGTGLGLHIVKAIAEAHAGTVSVLPTVRGAGVRLEVPAGPDAAAGGAPGQGTGPPA